MRAGRHAADRVRQQRPEGGPRLHPLVPGLCRRIIRPRNVAEIVDGRDDAPRRRGRQATARRLRATRGGRPGGRYSRGGRAAAPWPGARARVSGPPPPLSRAQEAADHLLGQHRLRHFGIELAVEPAREAAHLGALEGIAGDERDAGGLGLLEIFPDRLDAAQRGRGILQVDGQRAGRIELEDVGLGSQGFSSISSTGTPYSASASRRRRLNGSRVK